MKKVILLSSLVLAFLSFSCQKDIAKNTNEIKVDPNASFYLAKTKVTLPTVNGKQEPEFISSTADYTNRIMYFKYKIGHVDDCLMQRLGSTIEFTGSEINLSVTETTVTGKELSEGCTSYVSTTKTVDSTATTDSTEYKLNGDSVSKSVSVMTKQGGDLLERIKNASSKLQLDTSDSSSSSRNTTAMTESIQKSFTNETSVFNKISVTTDYDVSKFIKGKYYSWGIYADIDVYQVIGISFDGKNVVLNSIVDEIDEKRIGMKLVWSNDNNFPVGSEYQVIPLETINPNINEYKQDGSEEYPYIIYTKNDFDTMVVNANADKCFKLNTDIDLNNKNEGTRFSTFTGSFDGQGYRIYTKDLTKGSIKFCTTNKGTISNIQYEVFNLLCDTNDTTGVIENINKKNNVTKSATFSETYYGLCITNKGTITDYCLDGLTLDFGSSCSYPSSAAFHFYGICKTNSGNVYNSGIKNVSIKYNAPLIQAQADPGDFAPHFFIYYYAETNANTGLFSNCFGSVNQSNFKYVGNSNYHKPVFVNIGTNKGKIE